MALNLAALTSGIQSVCADPADSAGGCAQAWADAMGDYAATVVPPSTTVVLAKQALAAALAGAFASPTAAPGMESAFATFAVSVGAGMAPAFVAAPPPSPVGFASLFAQPPPATHAAAAAALAARVQAWMVTATATPAAGGAPIPWS